MGSKRLVFYRRQGVNRYVVEDLESWIAFGRGTVIWIPSVNFLAYLQDRPVPDRAIAYGYPVFERVKLSRWIRVFGLFRSIPVLSDLLFGTTLTRRFLCPRHPGPAEGEKCIFRPASYDVRYDAGPTNIRSEGA